eukprot:4152630-Prymnesium_polylepis.2
MRPRLASAARVAFPSRRRITRTATGAHFIRQRKGRIVGTLRPPPVQFVVVPVRLNAATVASLVQSFSVHIVRR